MVGWRGGLFAAHYTTSTVAEKVVQDVKYFITLLTLASFLSAACGNVPIPDLESTVQIAIAVTIAVQPTDTPESIVALTTSLKPIPGVGITPTRVVANRSGCVASNVPDEYALFFYSFEWILICPHTNQMTTMCKKKKKEEKPMTAEDINNKIQELQDQVDKLHKDLLQESGTRRDIGSGIHSLWVRVDELRADLLQEADLSPEEFRMSRHIANVTHNFEERADELRKKVTQMESQIGTLQTIAQDAILNSSFVKVAKSLLIGYLVLGFMVWVGGAVYGGVQINSVRQESKAAIQEIQQIERSVQDANLAVRQLLDGHTDDVRQATIDAIKEIEGEVERAKDTLDVDSLPNLGQLRQQIDDLKEEQGELNLRNITAFVDYSVLLIIGLVGLLLLLNIVVGIVRLIKASRT